MMASVEAFDGIRMQNPGLGNPPVQQWGKTLPSHLRALTATDQNAPPQSAYATPKKRVLLDPALDFGLRPSASG
jgi:hypothetical protein